MILNKKPHSHEWWLACVNYSKTWSRSIGTAQRQLRDRLGTAQGLVTDVGCSYSLKAGTHRPNHWMSEAFGESRTRSGTHMFSVFSWVGSCRSHADVVCSDWTCEVWGRGPSDAIGFSDWRCARESARYVGGAEHCVPIGFLRTPFRHSPFSCFAVLARD